MRHRNMILAVLCLSISTTAHAQFGGIINKATNAKDKVEGVTKQLVIDEQDEIAIGEQVSAKIRARYGVAQDPQTHKYVALVGSVLAKKTARPSLPWQFIILDTDGVNAFAAPGGYIHITRGALSLMKSEAELAGVLSHEIAHVTRKHTVSAIEKDRGTQTLLTKSNANAKIKDQPALLQGLVDKAYEGVFAGFGRAEELESDVDAPVLAARAGYAPSGLPDFLRTLDQRNKDSDQKQGLFASHPEMKERLEKLDKAVAQDKSGSTATVEARYVASVKYQAVPIGALTVDGAAPAAAADSKTEPKAEQKQSTANRFGNVLKGNSASSSSDSKQSASVTGSAGSRGVDRERQAKGGSNPSKVSVTVTDAEIAAFISEGKLKT